MVPCVRRRGPVLQRLPREADCRDAGPLGVASHLSRHVMDARSGPSNESGLPVVVGPPKILSFAKIGITTRVGILPVAPFLELNFLGIDVRHVALYGLRNHDLPRLLAVFVSVMGMSAATIARTIGGLQIATNATNAAQAIWANGGGFPLWVARIQWNDHLHQLAAILVVNVIEDSETCLKIFAHACTNFLANSRGVTDGIDLHLDREIHICRVVCKK